MIERRYMNEHTNPNLNIKPPKDKVDSAGQEEPKSIAYRYVVVKRKPSTCNADFQELHGGRLTPIAIRRADAEPGDGCKPRTHFSLLRASRNRAGIEPAACSPVPVVPAAP